MNSLILIGDHTATFVMNRIYVSMHTALEGCCLLLGYQSVIRMLPVARIEG